MLTMTIAPRANAVRFGAGFLARGPQTVAAVAAGAHCDLAEQRGSRPLRMSTRFGLLPQRSALDCSAG